MSQENNFIKKNSHDGKGVKARIYYARNKILYLQMKFHATGTTPVKMEESVVELCGTTNVRVQMVLQELTAKVSTF